MATRYKVKNAPAIISLEEVVIGSQVTPIAVHLMQEEPPGSEVFVDMDLTGCDMACHVKDNRKNDTEPDVEFTVIPRLPLTSGWVDLSMDGTETAKLSEKLYYGSLKVWPVDFPELGDTFVVLELPLKWEATR